MSVKRICECIIRNERSILPVSSMMHGEYGIDGISLSMPAIVGLTGIETHVPIALNAEEAEKLRASAETLKKINSIGNEITGLPFTVAPHNPPAGTGGRSDGIPHP